MCGGFDELSRCQDCRLRTVEGACSGQDEGICREWGRETTVSVLTADIREIGGVSVVDLNVLLDKKTTREEVNAALKEAADGPLKGILAYSEAELVSIDFRGNPNSSIVDAPYTKVMDGDFLKVLSWYDNEWGYSNRCVDLLQKVIVARGL